MDANLRLALLDESRGDPDWVEDLPGEYELARKEHVDWRTWAELAGDPLEPNPDLEEYVRSLPLDLNGVRGLTRLTLDGDREVYSWLGGEAWYDDEDLFVIRELSGLERLSKLEYLHLGQGLHRGCSLQPLAGLSHLRELWLCALDQYTQIEVILRLPALERLEVANVETSPERDVWERVSGELKARR